MNPPPRHDPYAVLRIRDFRLLLFGRFVNSIAFQMVEVIVGWQIYALTKDPLALGLVGLSTALPSITVSLYAGHLSDIKSRRNISLVTLTINLICVLGLLSISSHLEAVYLGFGTFPIYSILFIAGLASGFLAPAVIAFNYEIVPGEFAQNAAAWRSSSWQSAAVAGPALGGVLYGFIGATGAYTVACVLFVMGIVFVYMIPNRPAPIKERSETLMQSLKEGVSFVFKNQFIVGALSLDLFAVLFGGAVAMLPVFASDILKIGPEGLGVLRAAPAVGAVIMALWQAHHPMSGRIGKKLFIAVQCWGVTIIVFGLSKNVYLSVFALAVGGAFDSISVVVRATLVQLSTPNNMRGRVEAVNMMFIGSSNEIGAFESGVAARLLGVVPSVVFGGCMTLISVFVTGKLAPKLWKLNYEELEVASNEPS
ncbi:MAG TPA: MFS transporter [Candidatus Kapabacteria bacterium]|nr:MFS transporter [Candidatus Kapabacteria bacterium]